MFGNRYSISKLRKNVKEDVMLKKVADYFSTGRMTVISGVFLALSLALLITKNFVELNVSPYLDPAWGAIVISGFPLAYLAFSRLFKQRWISSALLITIAMISALATDGARVL